jgi:hypothetical protein
MQTEKRLNRTIFENAISNMEKHGKESMMSPRIFSKRHEIKKSLLKYYESTEEFEKCKFIIDFFEDLESASLIQNQESGPTGEFVSAH